MRREMQATFRNHVCVFFFFFFSRVCETCGYCSCIVHEQQLQSLTFLTFFSQSVHTVHCLWTHKFHFSAIFSLKMDPTVLFTHLKIILLQYFSVSIFNFQLYPNGPLKSRFQLFWAICKCTQWVKQTHCFKDRTGRSIRFNWEPRASPVRLKAPKPVNNQSTTGKPAKNR